MHLGTATIEHLCEMAPGEYVFFHASNIFNEASPRFSRSATHRGPRGLHLMREVAIADVEIDDVLTYPSPLADLSLVAVEVKLEADPYWPGGAMFFGPATVQSVYDTHSPLLQGEWTTLLDATGRAYRGALAHEPMPTETRRSLVSNTSVAA